MTRQIILLSRILYYQDDSTIILFFHYKIDKKYKHFIIKDKERESMEKMTCRIRHLLEKDYLENKMNLFFRPEDEIIQFFSNTESSILFLNNMLLNVFIHFCIFVKDTILLFLKN